MPNAQWKVRNLKVLRLRLDNMNYRLPEDVRGGTQRQIIHYLLNNYNVREIADSFARYGLLPHKQPIVVQEQDKFVVMEGNRRITALKCLINPKLAPVSMQGYFKRQAKNLDIESLRTIAVMEAPDKAAAGMAMFVDHALGLHSDWKPIMRSRFFVDAISEDGLEAVARAHGLGVEEVRKYALMYSLYKMACTFDYPDAVRKKVLNENRFPITTFERIVTNPPFSEHVNVSFQDGALKMGHDPEQFVAFLKKIVTDLAMKEEHSRSLNEASDLVRYFSEVIEECPLGGDGDFTFVPDDDESQGGRKKGGAQREKKEHRGHSEHKLIPDDFEVATDNLKIAALIDEGKKIYPNGTPHAAAFVLRAIIEMCVYHLFHKLGRAAELQNKNGRDIGLTDLLNRASSQVEIIQDPKVRKALGVFAKSEAFEAIETLNQYAHNQYVIPTKDQLKGFWSTIKAFIEYALKDDI